MIQVLIFALVTVFFLLPSCINVVTPEQGIATQKKPEATRTQQDNWVTWFDETMVLTPGQGRYLGGTVYGYIRNIQYSVDSTGKVDSYWVKTEADFKLMGKDQFSYYPQCSSESVVQYKSLECKVPGDSGLAIVNKESEDVRVKVLVRYKQ